MAAKKDILFSIIVPVYNAEKYLGQCVESILGQEYKNFELILVDDGSSDGSPKMCDEFAKKDHRVQVLHQLNARQTKARNAGLTISKGEYILFADSDDWLELDLLSVVNTSIKKHNPDIITFDTYFNYSDSRRPMYQSIPSGCFDKDRLLAEIYPKMIFSGHFFYFGVYAAMWNKVFKRSIVAPNIINVDERLVIGEDGVTTFASFLDAKKVCILGGSKLYNYRDDNISITRSYYKEQFKNALLLIESLRKINTTKAVYDLSSQIDYYFMYYVYCTFWEDFFYKHPEGLIKRVKYLRGVASNKFVRLTVKNISFDGMDRYIKIFFWLLKNNNINCLIVFSVFLAMKKRLKIYLRKLTRGN